MSQPIKFTKDTKLDNTISLIYVTVQLTWDKVEIVFKWENKILHPFPSVMPCVLKFREKFK